MGEVFNSRCCSNEMGPLLISSPCEQRKNGETFTKPSPCVNSSVRSFKARVLGSRPSRLTSFQYPFSSLIFSQACKRTHMSLTDVHALDSLSAHNLPQWLPCLSLLERPSAEAPASIMLRTRCNGTCVNDQCYDRIDEQGPLRLARIIHEGSSRKRADAKRDGHSEA